METAAATGRLPAAKGAPAAHDAKPPEFPKIYLAGRHGALTLITPVPWARVSSRRFRFAAPLIHFLDRRPRLQRVSFLKGLRALAFVTCAQWAVLGRWRPGGGQKLKRRYVLFDANFVGDFEQYIEGFSYRVPRGISLLWWKAIGPPYPRPFGPFLRYINDHKKPPAHFYAANPDATVRTVRAGKKLKASFDRFQHELEGPSGEALSADEFRRRYDAFVADVQRLI